MELVLSEWMGESSWLKKRRCLICGTNNKKNKRSFGFCHLAIVSKKNKIEDINVDKNNLLQETILKINYYRCEKCKWKYKLKA